MVYSKEYYQENKEKISRYIDGNRNNNSLNNLCSKCHGSKDSKRYWKNKQTGEIQCVCQEKVNDNPLANFKFYWNDYFYWMGN